MIESPKGLEGPRKTPRPCPVQAERDCSRRAWVRQELAALTSKTPWRKPSKTRRQRRRTAWLAGKTQECRVGVERAFGDDMLVTRVKRRPPTWLIEKYVDGEKVHLQLMKAQRGERHAFRWMLLGKGYTTVHSSRRMALRTAAGLRPVFDEEGKTDDAPQDE